MSTLMDRLRPYILLAGVTGTVLVVSFQYLASANLPQSEVLEILFVFLLVYLAQLGLCIRVYMKWRKER